MTLKNNTLFCTYFQVGDGVGDGDEQDQEDGGESEMLVSFGYFHYMI